MMKLSRLHDSTSVTAETVHIVSPRARTPPLVPTHRGSNEECVLLGLEYCTQTEATHTHTITICPLLPTLTEPRLQQHF